MAQWVIGLIKKHQAAGQAPGVLFLAVDVELRGPATSKMIVVAP
jgi:hypothetical protein